MEATGHDHNIDFKTILLTGATGFLGRAILQELLQDDTVTAIHCIAVRKPEKLPNSTKIHTYEGDLTEPLLGLTEIEVKNLTAHVDVIIHLAASRSFWDFYQLLKNVNVNPTKSLVNMSLPRKIPVHYVSSGQVCTFAEMPPVDGSNGYLSTKWACEMIFSKASNDFGIPVFVHRPVQAVGGSTDGVLRRFSELALGMNAVPDFGEWKGYLSLVPVDTVVRQICRSLITSSTAQSLILRGEVEISLEEIRNHFEKFGGSLEKMDLLKWFGKLKQHEFEFCIGSMNIPVGRMNVCREPLLARILPPLLWGAQHVKVIPVTIS